MSGQQSGQPHTDRGSECANVTLSEDSNFKFEPPTSRDPWNLVPRWPITHGQRIAELKLLATFYSKRGQDQNLQAAINWHSKFPPDEFVDESLCFEHGIIINESEKKLGGGPWWYEVSYNSYSL
jgi:hypothetical protein